MPGADYDITGGSQAAPWRGCGLLHQGLLSGVGHAVVARAYLSADVIEVTLVFEEQRVQVLLQLVKDESVLGRH